MNNSPIPAACSEPGPVPVAASAWFARMHSDQVTSEDEVAFLEWLDGDPEHRTAYEEAVRVWEEIGAMRGEPSMRPILRWLRSDVNGLSVESESRRWFLRASAAGIVVLGVVGWLGFQLIFGSQKFETEFGEQRRVALEDGSTLTLNTETRVRVQLDESERRIWLDWGQAHFIVAHDTLRPFRVFVGNEEVRALGTRFEVRRQHDSVQVTLEEGSIAIFREGQNVELRSQEQQAELVLEPGQQALIARSDRIQIAAVDTRRVTAWRFGQLILDAEPLSSAVAEINRYTARQIVLDSPELADMPISGLFQTGSPEAFVEGVSALLPIEVATQDDRSIHLRLSNAR